MINNWGKKNEVVSVKVDVGQGKYVYAHMSLADYDIEKVAKEVFKEFWSMERLQNKSVGCDTNYFMRKDWGGQLVDVLEVLSPYGKLYIKVKKEWLEEGEKDYRVGDYRIPKNWVLEFYNSWVPATPYRVVLKSVNNSCYLTTIAILDSCKLEGVYQKIFGRGDAQSYTDAFGCVVAFLKTIGETNRYIVSVDDPSIESALQLLLPSISGEGYHLEVERNRIFLIID